ncbi:MAG TPA: hypothetical protein VHB73_05235 [Alphaproteobacteria bacterium]|nr:hypothetical protein [Alphaproteobacteria bacterium]
MPRKGSSSPPSEEQLYQSLFDLVARQGWWDLTLPKIARAAKVPLPALVKDYADKNALLAGFVKLNDEKLAEIDLSEATNLKERLFEIFMRRFEQAEPYRKGLQRLLDEIVANPMSGICLAIEMASPFRRSMQLILELAEFSSRKPLRDVALLGLKLVHLKTLRTWKNDKSKDLSATMAALDQALDSFLSLLRLG